MKNDSYFLDTNIIYSALVNPDGAIAHILKHWEQIHFITPEYAREEIKAHWTKIEHDTTLYKSALAAEWTYYQYIITFVDEEQIPLKYFQRAFMIVRNIDPNDTAFVALHFMKECPVWSGDLHLIEGVESKGYKDIFLTTPKMLNLLKTNFGDF